MCRLSRLFMLLVLALVLVLCASHAKASPPPGYGATLDYSNGTMQWQDTIDATGWVDFSGNPVPFTTASGWYDYDIQLGLVYAVSGDGNGFRGVYQGVLDLEFVPYNSDTSVVGTRVVDIFQGSGWGSGGPVQFYDVPEPASLAVLGLPAIAILAKKGGKRRPRC